MGFNEALQGLVTKLETNKKDVIEFVKTVETSDWIPLLARRLLDSDYALKS